MSTVPDYDAISCDRQLAIKHFTSSAIDGVHYHYGEVPCEVLDCVRGSVTSPDDVKVEVPFEPKPLPTLSFRQTGLPISPEGLGSAQVRFHDGTMGTITVAPELLQDFIDTELPDSAPALAAVADVERIPLLQMDESWIIDTGCGSDLISASIGNAFKAYLAKAPMKTFHTANTTVRANKCLPGTLMDAVGNMTLTIDPYILRDAPSVISVGKQVKRGFSFIWLHNKAPCLITPDLCVIPLDVHGEIPYLREGGLHTVTRDYDALVDLCGLRTSPGSICIVSQDEPCVPAAECTRIDTDKMKVLLTLARLLKTIILT